MSRPITPFHFFFFGLKSTSTSLIHDVAPSSTQCHGRINYKKKKREDKKREANLKEKEENKPLNLKIYVRMIFCFVGNNGLHLHIGRKGGRNSFRSINFLSSPATACELTCHHSLGSSSIVLEFPATSLIYFQPTEGPF
jgi:hypothetical protein